MFDFISLIIPIAVFLPNLFYFGMPPINMPANTDNKENPIYKAAEAIGRFGVFILPIMSSIHHDNPYEILSLIGMVMFLLIYYVGWIRFVRGNREYKLLYSPMFGIPVPLAISPVLYFLSASILLHSPLLFLSSVILAIGHIPLSLKIYHQLGE